MTNALHSFKVWVAVTTVVVFGFMMMAQAALAEDAALTLELENNNPGETGDWTISFTAESGLSSGSYVYLYMPSSTKPSEGYFDATSSTLSSSNGSMTVDEWGTVSIVTSEDYGVGEEVTFVISDVVNVDAEGSYQLSGSYSDSETWNYTYLSSSYFVLGTVALDGKIIDPDTEVGVQGVYVNVYCYDNWAYGYADSAIDGTFQIAGDFDGDCEVSFSYWGEEELQAPSSETITFTSGETVYRNGVEGDAFEMLVPNVSATLQTPEGDGVANAWGWVYSSDWSYYNWFSTDENGYFSFALDTTGDYTLEIDISGTVYSGQYTAPDAIEFSYNATTDVTTGLDAIIELTEPNVIVNVYKPDGISAAPDWTYVYVYNSSYSVWEWGYTMNGSAVFNVEAGSYLAEVDWVGYDSEDPDSMYLPPDPKSFTAPDTDVEIVLEQANNTITANTYVSSSSAATGIHAVANTSIQAYYYGWTNDGRSYFWGDTGENGKMNQMVGAGTYTIYFDTYDWPKTNYFTQTYSASFADNSGTEQDLGNVIAVPADATIEVSLYNAESCGGGLVTSGAGVGVNSNTVWQWAELSEGVASVMVPAGTYYVDAYAYNTSCEQGSPNQELVTIGSGDTEEVAMSFLDRNAVLAGNVRDADGVGLGCQWVWGYKVNGGDWFDATTDSDGTWTDTVTPGTYFVQSYPSGMNSDNCDSNNEGETGAVEGGDMDEGDRKEGDGGYETYSAVGAGPTSDMDSTDSSGTGITYVSLEGTQSVVAKENATTNGINFTYAVADATLQGYFRYAKGHELAGEVVPGINGFVTVTTADGGRTGDFYSNAMYGWVDNSWFQLSVPASPEGGYQLLAYLDYYNNEYTVVNSGPEGINAAASTAIEVDSKETVDVEIGVLPNDASVSGSISGFVASAGFYATVCADNGDGGYGCTDAWSGTYELPLAAGTWTINYMIPDGYNAFPKALTDNTITLESGDAETVNFEIIAADSVIEGSVTDPDGLALPGAVVVISSTEISTSDTTDTNGNFSVNIPADTYTVVVNVPAGSGYLSPAAQDVIVASGDEESVEFTARSSDATISGVVTDATSAFVEGALVTAYSEDGAYTYTETDAAGEYSLDVLQDETWNVRATFDDDDGTAYDSGITSLAVDEATETLDIEFSSLSGLSLTATGFRATADALTLPASQRKSFSSTTQMVFSFSDNSNIKLPAYSTSSSSETMTGIITPTAEIPSTSTHQVLNYGYRVKVVDSNSSSLGKLNSAAAVSLAYTDAQLINAGVTEDDITLAIYDGTSWKDVSGAVVNTNSNTVSANTTKLGTFAITTSSRSVAAEDADLDAPTNLRSVKSLRKTKSFKVKWDAVTGATGYKVQLWKGKNKIKTTSTTKKNKAYVKRKGNAVYKVRVRAVNGSVISDWTDKLTVRTKPLKPTKMSVVNKAVNEDSTGTFRLRFNQRVLRKNLRAVVKMVDAEGTSIPFMLGSKDYATTQKFKMKSSKKVQKRLITVASDYVGQQLRVKVRAQNTVKPKTNSSGFAKSGLFIIE